MKKETVYKEINTFATSLKNKQMIKAIVIEDEQLSANLLLDKLRTNAPNVEVLGSYTSIAETVQFLANNSVDVVFMDIELEDGNSFSILEQLKSLGIELPKIIFTTGFNEFAVRAFQYAAVDYLLKPIGDEELISAIEKLKDRIGLQDLQKIETLLANYNLKDEKEKSLIINSIDQIHRIRFNSIIYCESYKNYTTFFLNNGEKVTASKTIKDYEEILNTDSFMRIHRSYLINTDFATKLIKRDGGFVLMSNGAEVPISSKKKDAVMQKIFR